MKLKNNYFLNVLLFLSIYLFIFSPRLNIGPFGHTGYIIVSVIFILAFFSKIELVDFTLIVSVLLFLFLATFHYLVSLYYSNDPIFFISIQLSLISYLLFGYFISKLLLAKTSIELGDAIFLIDKLIKFIAIAIFTNSTVILLEFLVPEIKLAIESVLINSSDANINYQDHSFRFRGFSSSGGAGLSIVNTLGIIFFIFLLHKNRISRFAALVCGLVIVTSNIFTGRTGLIFSIVFFLLLLLCILSKVAQLGWRSTIRSVGSFLIVSTLILSTVNFDIDPEITKWAFEWANVTETGKVETSSTDDLLTMLYLPSDLSHLLVGVGFFEGNDRIYPRTDSGYLKTLLSIGVPFSLILYGWIIFLLTRLIKISKQYTLLVWSLLAFMMLVEIKEPFLYQNFSARVIFLLSGSALFLTQMMNKKKLQFKSSQVI